MYPSFDCCRGWRRTVAAAALSCVCIAAWAAGPADLPRPFVGGLGAHAAHPVAGDASADRMVEHLARGLDLQPAQREQLRALAQAARTDLQALREQGRTLRQERHQLLGAATLDEAALEALRQRELAWHDALTARMNRFMIDSARVLTPEQRQRWAERMQCRTDGAHRHGMPPHGRHRYHPDR